MKKKNQRIIKIIFVVVLVGAFLAFIYSFYKSFQKKEAPKEEAKVEDKVEKKEFGYELMDNKSALYKEYFKDLKDELMKDVVNEEAYAKIVAQLFITDFYSLEDKNTSTDIGGLDFIHEDIRDNFVLKAGDTIYKYVDSNVYKDRKQELPKIKQVDIVSATNGAVTVGDASDPLGFVVVASITYEKDLGFPTQVTLSMVHVEKKLFIVEVK